MKPTDYNAIMHQMLTYANQNGSSLNFESYSQLYYKIKAMLDHAKRLYTDGMNKFVYYDDAHRRIETEMKDFCAFLDRLIDFAKDKDYKLQADHARVLNHFAKTTSFVYTPVATQEYDMDDILKSMQYLAGISK